MDRLPPARAATRTLARHRDARDLRRVIIDALAAEPIDAQMLRDGVWTYVRGEREVGVAPGVVILALTDMIERAKLAPDAVLADEGCSSARSARVLPAIRSRQ